jgi:hypothetical protein
MAIEDTGYTGEYSYGGETGSSYLDDILREEYDVYLTPEEREEHLWEYDPTEERAIRGATETQLGGMQTAGERELSKIRGGGGGGFAGRGGGGLLDMTIEDIYGTAGAEREKSLLGMSTDIYGRRKDYVTDIGAEVSRIAEEKGEEFQEWKGTEHASAQDSLDALNEEISEALRNKKFSSGFSPGGSWNQQCKDAIPNVYSESGDFLEADTEEKRKICRQEKEDKWMADEGYTQRREQLEASIAGATEAGV